MNQSLPTRNLVTGGAYASPTPRASWKELLAEGAAFATSYS